MPQRRARFLKHVTAINARAPTRRAKAERFIRAYYRAHRDLPRGAAAYLHRQRLYAVIFVGELEHRLGLARLLLRLSVLRRSTATAWARRKG